ncbi:receptor for retinol uptake STRA6 [Aquila chrysaetos chrysaetos]|uniref:receptor for retinol uptake STRA6 n=1 Tax=Aquila chrysaetos chrysaetos TaxID=223781 RepID=UPI001177284B|nr:receptor for retinol uptake STRA6 [Aquila chrysaetos chrysaetos]XP_029869230.1 receptor for retinol uptake STRA6 [Aquila chrysaetos chrysaetos]XP_029869231.1 receptor for retinol uptake STRA6 [Aquila chrysaetos chrysaetos]XP_029869232.1 receptor for retinol uptake STRA6 [Aquila chrysaetos chrysaetos]
MAANGSGGMHDALLDNGFAGTDELVSDWYIYETMEPAVPQDDVFSSGIPDCNPTVSPRLYHICMAPVSLAVLVGLSLLVKRRRLHWSCWNGVPGLLSPANFLEEEGNRGLVAAVFGILFSSLCVLVLDRDPLPLIAHSSQSTREYWKILALLYYPAFYYPLIACATVRHRVSYLVGCLLSWCHCVVHIWQKVDCPQSPKIYRYYSTLSYIPIILCLVLLSLWYPALLIRSFTGQEETLDKEVTGQGYYKKYLKAVLSKHPRKGSSTKIEENLLSRVQTYLRSYIYVPEEGFRIPLKLVLSITTAVLAVYQVALLLLVAVVPTIQIVRAGMTKDIVILLVQFGLVPSESPAVPGDMEKELNTVKYYLWSLEVCYICSLVLCCLLTCAMLLRTLVMHRNNLKALYQGAVLDVFYKAHILRPSRQAIVCWMSFAAFQTAFACLGLLIQQVIFFICSVGFTFLFIIPLQSGTNTYLFKIIQNMWPFWLTLVVAVIVQNLAAHYQFLEQHPLRKELTNRRALYIVTYLLFPINVLVGVLAGVWRMVISGLYNAVHFSQLDISLLNRSVENFDPGYHAYCHYLKIEVSQSHPVMKAFCLLLLQLAKPEGPPGLQASNVEEGIQLMQPKKAPPSRARFKQSRARWWLAYTLLKNPSLTACRKTALSDPTANGTQLSPPKP